MFLFGLLITSRGEKRSHTQFDPYCIDATNSALLMGVKKNKRLEQEDPKYPPTYFFFSASTLDRLIVIL